MALTTNPQDTTVAVFPSLNSARQYAGEIGWYVPEAGVHLVRAVFSEEDGGHILVDTYGVTMTLGDLPY